MLFKTLAVIGFAAATVVADGAAIVTALNGIAAKNAQFNNTLASWDGSLFGAIPILIQSGDLDDAVKAATQTANASAPLDLTEATNVYVATNNLIPGIKNTVDTLIAAKPKFDKLGVTFITQGNLQTISKDSSALGAAVVAKVPADLQSFANGVVAQINAQFARATAVYGTPLFSFL